jgi:hypothetical protein
MMIDLLLALWLTTVASVLLLLAPRLFALREPDRILRTAEAVGLLTLIAVVSVGALSQSGLLNWLTLMLVCVAAPVARWLAAYGWSGERALRHGARHTAIAWVALLESGTLAGRVAAAIRGRRDAQVARSRRAVAPLGEPSSTIVVLAAILTAAAAVTVYLRYGPVLGELRLGSPEAYAVLLEARQALFNRPAGLTVSVTPALVAALSLATSLNPFHVVRLLAPGIGVAMVLAAALFAYRLSKSVPAAAAVSWILGACTFAFNADAPTSLGPLWVLDRTMLRQWTANDGTTGLLFLMLAGICITGVRRDCRHAAYGAAACLAVVALASPALLLLLVPAAVAALVPRPVRFVTFSGLWTATAFYAASRGTSDLAFTLPAAVAFVVPAACALGAQYLGRATRIDLQPVAASALVLLTVPFLPHASGALYLEHEVTAMKTLEIASSFPRGRWLIVAPLEQLAETYGRGWFEEPATFLAENAHRSADPGFTFKLAVDDLFVFVERRPFKTFGSEAVDVPFSTLADPSYRQYRSLAGRASLQARLHAMCEAYARTHPSASIYYEDAQIRIYRFRIRA